MSTHRVYTQLDELIGQKLYAGQLTLRFDSRRLQQVSGVHLSRFKGKGVDFAEYRQYQPGDDPRTIDWRVTARRGRPHTRLYHEEVEKPVLIMVDQSQSMFFGSRYAFKSVRAAELGSLLSWVGLSQGDKIGGLVFSDFAYQAIKPSRHPKQALRLLECINSYNNALRLQHASQPSFRLNEGLMELRRIARPGSQCLLISDWRQFDAETEKLLFELNRHCQVLLFQIFDPLESHLPPGRFQISNHQSLELEINTLDRGIEDRFSQRYTEWRDNILLSLARIGVGCASISTHDQPLEHLRYLQFGAHAAQPGASNPATDDEKSFAGAV